MSPRFLDAKMLYSGHFGGGSPPTKDFLAAQGSAVEHTQEGVWYKALLKKRMIDILMGIFENFSTFKVDNCCVFL